LDPKPYLDRRFGRRAFLKGVGALALTGVAAPLAACAGGTPSAVTTPSPSSSLSLRTPIRHVLVAMQENRSFDHYYGYAPFAGSHGVPADYRNPDGRGGFVKPHHLTRLTSADISHTWDNTHREHHRGAMDGFYTTDGPIAMGYYTADDLPYYYSLIESSALCVKYFCSVLGPTYPNRLYLAAGTAGGLTTNGVFGYGVIDYPCILDLLEDAGVSWKVYNIGLDSVERGDSNNVFYFFKRWARDARTAATKDDYLRDLEAGLPQMSFIVPGFTNHLDEHPPADVSAGMGMQRELITALQKSAAWKDCAYVLTYDEAGGFFDHKPPPQLDSWGLGIRVPTWVISPFAKPRHLEPALYDHTSILKFIERVFGLPTLASVNHQFDESTPTGPNHEAGAGRASGPPAAPRDSRFDLGNLMECFSF